MYDHMPMHTERVELTDGTIILMEVQGADDSGPMSVQSLQIAMSQTLKAVSSLAADLKEALAKAKPDKATVEFSIELEKKDDDILSKICGISGKGAIGFHLEWNFGDKGKPEAAKEVQ